MLVPVLGLVQVGEQGLGRPLHLPAVHRAIHRGGLGLQRIRAAGNTRPKQFCDGWLRRWGLALLVGTWVQLRYWKDTRTLFEHAAQVTRNNPARPRLFWAACWPTRGKFDEAIQYYRTALRYAPGFPEAHFYLGHAPRPAGQAR
jgi:tetratricopeptide (TPR) repeat protein